MSRTNSRSEKMTRTVWLRATEADVASLKLNAMQRGVDVSALIRQTLIKEKLINPV